MNGQYIARMAPGELAAALRDALGRDGVAPADIALGEEAFARMAAALAPRSRNFTEMARLSRPYTGPVRDYDPKATRKNWYRDPAATTRILAAVRDRLAATAWEPEALEGELRALAGELGVGAGKVFQPLRVALTGVAASPGIFDVLLILGRERALERVERALERIATGP